MNDKCSLLSLHLRTDEMSVDEQQQRRTCCCISHVFHAAAAAAAATPAKISIVHASTARGDLDRPRISSSPPVYDGDEYFTSADLLLAFDSFFRRLLRVLDGGHDPDFVRPPIKDVVHDNLGAAAARHGDNDMQHSQGGIFFQWQPSESGSAHCPFSGICCCCPIDSEVWGGVLATRSIVA